MQNDRRMKLGFTREIEKQFNFLVIQFNFVIVHSDDYYIKYESPKSYVEIYHDRISYEVSIVFGINKKGTANSRVSITDILESKHVNIANGLFQASSESSLKKVIDELACLVKNYSKEFLLGDMKAFNSVQSHISNNTNILNKRNMLSVIENQAKSAWENGEYENVIALYSEIVEDLNEIQKRKLSYAKSKIAP
jgi:hypothetical protein